MLLLSLAGCTAGCQLRRAAGELLQGGVQMIVLNIFIFSKNRSANQVRVPVSQTCRGPFSAVSTPPNARLGSFFCIFRDLQDYLSEFSIFCRFSRKKTVFFFREPGSRSKMQQTLSTIICTPPWSTVMTCNDVIKIYTT